MTGYHAPLLLGGREAPSALSGAGFATLTDAPRLAGLEVASLGDGYRVTGRLDWPAAA